MFGSKTRINFSRRKTPFFLSMQNEAVLSLLVPFEQLNSELAKKINNNVFFNDMQITKPTKIHIHACIRFVCAKHDRNTTENNGMLKKRHCDNRGSFGSTLFVVK